MIENYIILHFEHPALGDIPHLLKIHEVQSGIIQLRSTNLNDTGQPFYINLGDRNITDSIGYQIWTSFNGVSGMTEKDLPEILKKYQTLHRWQGVKL